MVVAEQVQRAVDDQSQQLLADWQPATMWKLFILFI